MRRLHRRRIGTLLWGMQPLMRLTIRALGLELLHIHLTDTPEHETDEQDDDGCHLSGGTLTSYPVEAHDTDWHMGFTGGLEE